MTSRCSTTLRTDNLVADYKKSSPNKIRHALVTVETVVVPVPTFKRDELCRPKTGDGSVAAAALLGKQLSKAVCAILFSILRCKLFARQLSTARGADEAFPMPRRLLINNSCPADHAVTFDTSLCVLRFIAWDTHSVRVTWYERPGFYLRMAHLASEALIMKLLSIKFVLLHTSAKQSLTGVTALCEVLIMTFTTVDSVVLMSEHLVYQRTVTIRAVETSFVPVHVFVRQISEVGSNWLLAADASVSKAPFIALNAVRIVIEQNIAPSC